MAFGHPTFSSLDRETPVRLLTGIEVSRLVFVVLLVASSPRAFADAADGRLVDSGARSVRCAAVAPAVGSIPADCLVVPRAGDRSAVAAR